MLLILIACGRNKNAPDVSGIHVVVPTERFEKDFFSLDTNAATLGIANLEKKYPDFAPVFFGGVLGLPDSSAILTTETKKFISLNRSIYDTAMLEYNDFSRITKEFENSFQYVKYYFPNYKLPKLITLIGPIDAMAKMQNGDMSTDFLGPDFLGISLQFYLGKNFSLYQAQYFIDNVAPLYRSRRFEKQYIAADGMKLIVDDLFPDKSTGKPLIEQIIEKGKQWWLLDRFMPYTADSLKTGYTKQQLDWARENEGNIWTEILADAGDLYTTDPTTIQSFIGESPRTTGMPDISPGNIGPWVGWQIIKKFEEKNPSASITQIMQTPAREILDVAKYRPK